VRFAVNTNILVYAAVRQSGPRHPCRRRCDAARFPFRLHHHPAGARRAVPRPDRQVQGTPGEASAAVNAWRSAVPVVAADEDCLVDAMDAVAGHGLSFWDSMMWATAKRAGCRLLLTEDSDDGRTLGGPTHDFAPWSLRTKATSCRTRCRPPRRPIGQPHMGALDQGIIRHVGIVPVNCAILAPKSSVHFRADFAPIERIIVAIAPGPGRRRSGDAQFPVRPRRSPPAAVTATSLRYSRARRTYR
jgi:predicted nucleic acid-binding protein